MNPSHEAISQSFLFENVRCIPIEDHSGYYALESGHILSLKGQHPRILKEVTNKGYRMVNLSAGGSNSSHLVHRLIAMAFIPNPEGLPQINHIDHCRDNNEVSNLEWVSAQGNMNHAKAGPAFKAAAEIRGRVADLQFDPFFREACYLRVQYELQNGATVYDVVKEHAPMVRLRKSHVKGLDKATKMKLRKAGVPL